MRYIFPVILIVNFLLIIDSAFCQRDTCDYEEIPVEIFRTYIERFPNVVIIDTRIASEYKKSHVLGSISAPGKSELYAIADTLDTDQPLMLYCSHDQRSKTAASLLIQKGFCRVYVLSGGVNSWIEHNFPVNQK